MNEQLAAIKARREAVTPGVTNTCAYFTGTYGEYDGGTEILADNKTVAIVPASNANEIADAEFYAAAPADIDTLLAHVAALAAERDALAQQLQQAQAELVQWRAKYAASSESWPDVIPYDESEPDGWPKSISVVEPFSD